MDETEQLQRAFGITPLAGLPANVSVVGAAFIDGTDHAASNRERQGGSGQPAPAPPLPPPRRRPWWRFW